MDADVKRGRSGQPAPLLPLVMPAHIWSDHVRFRTPRLLESPGAIALLFISHFFSSGFFLFPPSFPLPDTWFRHIYTSRVPVTLPTFQTKKKSLPHRMLTGKTPPRLVSRNPRGALSDPPRPCASSRWSQTRHRKDPGARGHRSTSVCSLNWGGGKGNYRRSSP